MSTWEVFTDVVRTILDKIPTSLIPVHSTSMVGPDTDVPDRGTVPDDSKDKPVSNFLFIFLVGTVV